MFSKLNKYSVCLIVTFFILKTSKVFSQVSQSACKILKNGKFKYLDAEDTSGYIIISNNSHIEYHNNGKYFIKSKLQWLTDCSYVMTMTENTLPNFPFHPGDKMEVDVQRIENGIIYYISKINGEDFPGRLQIISVDNK